MRLFVIVEGAGDIDSTRILLTRLAIDREVYDLQVSCRPYARNKIVRPGELERLVELGAREVGAAGGILVLLDADDDLPCVLAPLLAARAKAARSDAKTAIVLANREFEAWFIAAIQSLRGQRDIPLDSEAPDDPEAIRGAKEWLGKRMNRTYSEVEDQPKLAARFSFKEAKERSRSFDKLCREVDRLLAKS